jgi:cobalt/nickel transport system permease protein
MRLNHRDVPVDGDAVLAAPPGWRAPLVGLGVMAALVPLGLLAPGSAFGESAPGDIQLKRYHLNAVPHGLQRYAGFWHNALFHGYDFRNDTHPVLGYVVSALVGVLVIAAVFVVSVRLARRVRRSRTPVGA